MTYKIETNNWECLLDSALKNEMAKKWEESLFMATKKPGDQRRYDVFWDEEIDHLADFRLQLLSQRYGWRK